MISITLKKKFHAGSLLSAYITRMSIVELEVSGLAWFRIMSNSITSDPEC